MRTIVALSLVCAVGACSSSSRRGGRGGDGSTGQLADGATSSDGGGPSDAVVYGHSASTLYSIDPNTLAVTKIADFGWPGFPDGMTDIAVDKDGNMTGISQFSVYSVNVSTGECTTLSAFSGNGFNGLTYISADQTANGTEILVGADTSGDLFEIDPSNGSSTKIGSYGGGWGSSGDLVSVEGATYATVTNGNGYDRLAKIDISTGAATIIGATNATAIYGLGYWKSTVFGFTDQEGMITIDVKTGQATTAPSGNNVEWYGAGVTTAAPVTIN